MPKFRSRPVEVEAVQWFKPGDHPAVERKPLYDLAGPINNPRRLGWSFEVLGKQGWSRVNPGDWIITEPDGSGHYPCADSVFCAKYEEITDEG